MHGSLFRPSLVVGALAVLGGCYGLPRHPAILGQTAAPAPVGGAEAALSVGGGYQSYTSSTTTTAGSTTTTTASTSHVVTAPYAEANFLYGLSETLGLNVHAGPSGLHPGVKVTLVHNGGLDLAVLPSAGIGYFTGSSSSTATSGGATASRDTGSESALLVTAGARLLLSLPGGFYAGLGYDFQYGSQTAETPMITSMGTTTTVTDTSSYTLHTLASNVGYDIPAGPIHVRPELSFLFSPAGSLSSSTVTTNNPTIDSEWMVLGAVTFAVPTSQR